MKRPSFMQGRYGVDKLFFAVTALCLLILILSFTVLRYIPHISIKGVLGINGLIMIVNTARIFSKDIGRRQLENIRFTLWLNKLRGHSGTPRPADRQMLRPQKNINSTPKCSCGTPLDIPAERGSHIVICKNCGKRNLVKK